jgi:catechol 2,3-dioxygenase-like lactoylglutathione lyase family enzyme
MRLKMYEIAGVHHVALGVKNLETMKSFYKGALGFNTGPQEPPAAPHEIMSEITRGVTPVFAASMLSQDADGIIVEFIQMITPSPRAIRQDFCYGDIGTNKMAIAVSDVNKLYRELKDRVNFCSSPKSAEIPGYGTYNFVYSKDPEGNLIELASGAKLPVKNRFGGVCWVGISVTDLKRSMTFYQKYIGFDTLFIKPHENFSGLVDEVSGNKQTKVRSCILASSKGGGMVELFEVLEPRGRSIPSYTLWGDFGYLQTCLMCKNVPEIAAHFEKEGLAFILKLQRMPGEERAAFTYVRDPDGIPLEFLSFDKSD